MYALNENRAKWNDQLINLLWNLIANFYKMSFIETYKSKRRNNNCISLLKKNKTHSPSYIIFEGCVRGDQIPQLARKNICVCSFQIAT